MKKMLFFLTIAGLFIGSARAQEPRKATLTQQKMCADQAKRVFNESDASKESDKKVIPAEYTSHYDAKTNVCYIMVHTTSTVGDGKRVSISIMVYDAFEGRVYANYLWFSDEVKKYWEVAPMFCSVKPRGQDEILCKTPEEFDRLVDKYFGIGL